MKRRLLFQHDHEDEKKPRRAEPQIEERRPSLLSRLPPELVNHILSFLSWSEVRVAIQVCHEWRSLLLHQPPPFWKQLYTEEFQEAAAPVLSRGQTHRQHSTTNDPYWKQTFLSCYHRAARHWFRGSYRVHTLTHSITGEDHRHWLLRDGLLFVSSVSCPVHVFSVPGRRLLARLADTRACNQLDYSEGVLACAVTNVTTQLLVWLLDAPFSSSHSGEFSIRTGCTLRLSSPITRRAYPLALRCSRTHVFVSSTNNVIEVWDLKSRCVVHTIRSTHTFVNSLALVRCKTSASVCACASASASASAAVCACGAGQAWLATVLYSERSHALYLWKLHETEDGISVGDKVTMSGEERGMRGGLCTRTYFKRTVYLHLQGNQAVVGVEDFSTLWVWDVQKAECVREITHETATVCNVAVCGTMIVAAYSDATNNVWDVKTGECLYRFRCCCHGSHNGKITFPRFYIDKYKLVTCCGKDLHIYNLGNFALVRKLSLVPPSFFNRKHPQKDRDGKHEDNKGRTRISTADECVHKNGKPNENTSESGKQEKTAEEETECTGYKRVAFMDSQGSNQLVVAYTTPDYKLWIKLWEFT